MTIDISYYQKISGVYGVNSDREYNIQQSKELITDDFEEYIAWKKVKINDIDREVWIFGSSNALYQGNDLNLVVKPDEIISVGDIIDWDNKKWLLKSVKPYNEIYNSGIIEECNNVLKFYKDSVFYQIPCIFNGSSTNMTSGKFMSLPSGHSEIFIKNDGIIDKSDLNLRFILNGSAYKVEGIDNSVNGLIKIEVVDDTINDDDKPNDNIANYYSNQITSSQITSTGWSVYLTPTIEKLMLGRTLELTAHAYNNGVEDNTKFFLYTITNDDGSNNTYVTSTILTHVCKLVAGTKSNYAGKIINVHCSLLGDPTIYYDRKIKLISF